MAGSYNHVVVDNGNLASNNWIAGMLENGGDVFEAIEQMYGMIWWLAKEAREFDQPDRVKMLVEAARQNYQEGLTFSKEIHRLSPDQRRD